MIHTDAPKSTRTRVLLMATSMRGGGSEHQVALLARHLPRDQFDVHLYLTERTGELLAGLPEDVPIHGPEASRSACKPVWRRLADRWPGTILRRDAADFAAIVERLRIDVIYDRAFPNTLIAGHPSIARKQRGVRRVSTIVSPPHVALPMVEKRFVGAKLRMLAGAYRRSEVVIAVSDAAADSAAEYYGLPRERIVVIANPVDINGVRASAADEIRAKIAAKGKNAFATSMPATCHLVCVGRMTKEKGQRDLIDAIDKLAGRLPAKTPRLSIRFVGDGPERGSLQRQWAALAGPDGSIDGHRCEFAGVVTPATREIARADGLVLPSHFEGMPNVVLEAFALETPVIATRSGGTEQLQQNTHEPTCFWAEVRSPDSLAEALAKFLGDPRRAAEHVNSARKLLQQKHTLEAAVVKIATILGK